MTDGIRTRNLPGHNRALYPFQLLSQAGMQISLLHIYNVFVPIPTKNFAPMLFRTGAILCFVAFQNMIIASTALRKRCSRSDELCKEFFISVLIFFSFGDASHFISLHHCYSLRVPARTRTRIRKFVVSRVSVTPQAQFCSPGRTPFGDQLSQIPQDKLLVLPGILHYFLFSWKDSNLH